MRVAALFAALGLASSVTAHPGGLDAAGCHHDRKNGGYHCHRPRTPHPTYAPSGTLGVTSQQVAPTTDLPSLDIIFDKLNTFAPDDWRRRGFKDDIVQKQTDSHRRFSGAVRSANRSHTETLGAQRAMYRQRDFVHVDWVELWRDYQQLAHLAKLQELTLKAQAEAESKPAVRSEISGYSLSYDEAEVQARSRCNEDRVCVAKQMESFSRLSNAYASGSPKERAKIVKAIEDSKKLGAMDWYWAAVYYFDL